MGRARTLTFKMKQTEDARRRPRTTMFLFLQNVRGRRRSGRNLGRDVRDGEDVRDGDEDIRGRQISKNFGTSKNVDVLRMPTYHNMYRNHTLETLPLGNITLGWKQMYIKLKRYIGYRTQTSRLKTENISETIF